MQQFAVQIEVRGYMGVATSQPLPVVSVPVCVHLLRLRYLGIGVGKFLSKYKKDCVRRAKHSVKF